MKAIKTFYEVRKVTGFVDMAEEKSRLTTCEEQIMNDLFFDDEYNYEVVEKFEDISFVSYQKGMKILDDSKNEVSVVEKETECGKKYYQLAVEIYIMVEVDEYEDGVIETSGSKDYRHLELPTSWAE